MSKKKSYMNKNNIVTEGFFDNIKKYGFEKETDEVYYSKDLDMGVFNESFSYRR